jgi:hypothetical protein
VCCCWRRHSHSLSSISSVLSVSYSN